MNINKGHEYALNQEDGHLDVFPPAKGLSYMTHKRILACISSICLHNYAQAADCRQKLLKKPDKFRRIEKSGSFIRSEITSNGDIVWIYDPEKNTVFIRNLTSSEKLPEPAIYALLNDNIFEKYMVTGQEMESNNPTPAYKIELASHESDNEDTREYLLWIDPDGLIPLKLESWDKGNPVLTLEYRDYSINCTTNDSDFTFTIPDDASVMYI